MSVINKNIINFEELDEPNKNTTCPEDWISDEINYEYESDNNEKNIYKTNEKEIVIDKKPTLYSPPQIKKKLTKYEKITRLFPFVENRVLISKLKIDDESIYYISIREIAEKISSILIEHLALFNMHPQNTTVTDCTGGVGGDTLSFCKYFKFVHSIEIDKLRCEYLENNLEVYNYHNVKTYNADCTEIVGKIKDHNIIFIDPPWGGKSYKNYTKLKLQMSNISLEMLCCHLFDKTKMEKVPELIALKLPKNYDICYLYNTVKKCKMYLYDLEKMYIIVLSRESD
jgi:16S rRNA G966 N2-methylase RsmD